MTAGTDTVSALSAAAGLPLTAYRSEFVRERVTRAIAAEEVGGSLELARRLRDDAAARARFRRSIAISVSGMFRDPEQFGLLERTILPGLLADPRRLTVWSAGCADGTEVFSVAALLERAGALARSTLLGSDVLDENVQVARRDARLRCPQGVRMVFERRDLTVDAPPPGRWRLILCRNVAIYLGTEAREALHRNLAGALATGGVLLLGRSEALPRAESLGLVRVAPHAYARAR